MADDYSDLDLSNPTPVDPYNQGAVNKFLYNNLVPEYLKSEFYKPHINPDYDPKNPSKAKLGYTPGTEDFAAKALPDILSWLSPVAKGAGLASKGIVPSLIAAKLSTRMGTLPSKFEDQLIKQGAEFTPEGINLNVSRWQKPQQAGHPALSQGVIYGPKGSDPDLLKGYEEGEMWGGNQLITGNTLIKNPLLVEGEWRDSLANQGAKDLFGLKGSASLRNDAVRAADEATIGKNPSFRLVNKFMDKYVPGGNTPPYDIYYNPRDKHNTFNRLGLWLQESAVANEARKRGYDSILDYGPSNVYGKGWQEPNQINQLFDLRESHYPTPEGGYKLWPQYQSIIDKLKGQQ